MYGEREIEREKRIAYNPTQRCMYARVHRRVAKTKNYGPGVAIQFTRTKHNNATDRRTQSLHTIVYFCFVFILSYLFFLFTVISFIALLMNTAAE